ncbi:hypothetical protein BVG19_g3986 [[Candida] boidinii]|nr:hypothetical protein BVG19_g3986 [[Candida] boidinii]OWB52843.1 hypothetical protein B5S27_g4426 [[Candida] boidinii]
MTDTNVFEENIKVLKGNPSTGELISLLAYFASVSCTIDDIQTLQLVVTLLETILPVYNVFETSLRQKCSFILGCRIGVSQLLIRGKSSITTNDLSSVVISQIIVDLISFNSALERCWSSAKSSTEIRELKRLLLFRVPEFLNEIVLEKKELCNEIVIETSKRRVFFNCLENGILNLIRKDSNYRSIFEIVQSLSKVSPSKYIIQNIFEDTKIYEYILATFQKASNNDKCGFILDIFSYLEDKVDDFNIIYYLVAIKNLKFDFKLLPLFYSTDIQVQKTYAVLCYLCNPKLIVQIIKKDLQKFGSEAYIKSELIVRQRSLACKLMILAKLTSREVAKDLTTSPFFLNCVSNRLDSNLPIVRHLGMSVAEALIGKVSERKKLFDIEDQTRFYTELEEELGPLPDFDLLERLTISEALAADKNKSIKTINSTDALNLNLASLNSTLKPFDSDNEDGDDVDNLGDDMSHRKAKIVTPVFLKDLLNYIRIDSSKTEDAYYKFESAYNIGISLIRAKSGTDELRFYSGSIVNSVMDLSNNYNFENFETWKLQMLIALTVGDYENVVEHMINCFVTGDYSLSQRIMILSCLSLSCRELSGFEDAFAKPNNYKDIKFKMLPAEVHQQTLLYDNLEENFSRMSLTRKKAEKVRIISFFNKIGKYFFFPLISLWFNVNEKTNIGFNVGRFSAILNSHFFKTLSIILDCALPLAHDSYEIVNESLILSKHILNNLLIGLRFENDDKTLIFDSVLSILISLLRTNTNNLMSNHIVNLLYINEVLVSIFESRTLVDQKVTQRTAYVVQEIGKIESNH